MFTIYSNRREFLKYIKFSLLLLLSSCSNISQKVTIALQSSFYPNSFKDTIPNGWKKNNFDLGNLNSEKKIIFNSDFTLINDGWINNINFGEFKTINESSFLEKLDKRSRDYLGSFEENQRNKLFPIGVVPYAIIIKNNKDLIYSAKQSWDFLLSEKLNKKIIFPKSPRILLSIAEKLNASNALSKLKRQAMLFDDQNNLNWLINSDACVAILPYSLCSKYLKIDSRLSLVFPKQGVPLMWHFVLSRSNQKNAILIDWVEALESKSIGDKLLSQGWYLPFKKADSQRVHISKNSETSGPSQECWDNSWSFPILTNLQKINYEDYWNQALTP